jgi:hypothetical protein
VEKNGGEEDNVGVHELAARGWFKKTLRHWMLARRPKRPY